MDQESQMLEYQVQQLQKIMETIDTQIIELNNTVDSLREFSKLEKSDVMMPVANGIFVKGTVTDTKNVTVNVGQNVMVEKTIDEAIIMMEKQLNEMNTYRGEVADQLQKIMMKLGE